MPRTSHLLNVGIPNEPDGVVKVWSAPVGLFSDLLGIYMNPRYGDFTHPVKGFGLSFTKEVAGRRTDYRNLLPGERERVAIDDWKRKVYRLDTFIKPFSVPDIRRIMNGEEPTGA